MYLKNAKKSFEVDRGHKGKISLVSVDHNYCRCHCILFVLRWERTQQRKHSLILLRAGTINSMADDIFFVFGWNFTIIKEYTMVKILQDNDLIYKGGLWGNLGWKREGLGSGILKREPCPWKHLRIWCWCWYIKHTREWCGQHLVLAIFPSLVPKLNYVPISTNG